MGRIYIADFKHSHYEIDIEELRDVIGYYAPWVTVTGFDPDTLPEDMGDHYQSGVHVDISNPLRVVDVQPIVDLAMNPTEYPSSDFCVRCDKVNYVAASSDGKAWVQVCRLGHVNVSEEL